MSPLLFSTIALTPSDVVALFMLAVMALALGMVGWLAYRLNANGKRPATPEERLLEEIEEDERSERKMANTGGEDDSLEPWEKPGDWWKDDEQRPKKA